MNSRSNSSDREQVSQNELFPIVGMGASAGGLEAFRELLSHLPVDTGMAFVLIQHLSPHQKSLLTEILSRTTKMAVVEAENGMVVEANHVYVIPPNSMMTISQGILQLRPREKIRGFFMTVDTFFLSLAEERGNKAIGVVLSGGDSDGTKGLESIKAAGGITFAQCEASAKVDSMPNTAVASGSVDFILTPQEIAEELANISHHPYINHPTSAKAIDTIPETGDALTNIFSMLRTATKVDFSHYKKGTLKRRVDRRMMLCKVDKLENYVSYIQQNPTEVKALYQDLLITVTSFFRDPEAFEALNTEIWPIITKNKTPNSPIRVWVAGCSTGEEAYSIAISLLEFLTTHALNIPIQIFASDINELAIEQARIGIYKINQVANVSGERLQRFFLPIEGGYQISKAVRELCVFARQNLIGDPPFSRLDLITCRNVLIYLSSAVQKKLLPIFHYGLNSNGFLMLGTSETVGEFLDLFALVDRKNKIYSRKISTTRLGIDLITNNYPLKTVEIQPPVSADTWNDMDLYKAADLIVLNDYAPVGVIINEDCEILQFRGYTSPYLQPPLGRPNFNLMKMAKDELRLELHTAIHKAKNREEPVSKSGIIMTDNEQVRQVKIDVVPFKPSGVKAWYFVVLFASTSSSTAILEAVSPPEQSRRRKPNAQDQDINRLKQDLAANKEYLQSIIEEQQATNEDLRAANEEILSSNEELQSTNEELETAKEEIQATNEELNTINDELQRRNIESNQVTNDLQNLFSSINIPILMLGGHLQIRRYTPVAEKIFNLISTDMGRPISDINHNLNIPDLEKQILDVINTLNFKTQEVQDKNGRWYDLRIRPYRTIDNKIDGAVVILVDIDDLKRSSEEIKTSRDYVQAIVDTMREPLMVLDVNLRVISANQFFYDTFQVLPAQTEQRLVYEIGNRQWDIPQLRSLLEEILPYENQFQGLEVEHNFEQIGPKIMRLNARKMTLVDNREMILLVIEDITLHKQFEAERTQLLAQEQSARNAAEAANRAKDEFLSILSHELRNPLNSMLGWANLLQKKQFDQATIDVGLAAIERSAQAQAHLITDLLDISRISVGRLRMDAQKLDLVSVIESAIEVVRFSAEAKNIQIQSQLTPVPKNMVGDANRLQQVFWNLLSNSIKFTPNGGKVTITLDYTDFQAQIQISDTGSGISADFLPYVFERFRQADGSRTRSNPGLGLGLSIVRYLVELHGGTIDAESPGEGKGATFTISLPLQAPKEQISLPTSTEPAACISPLELPMDEIPSLEEVRVLVVDDQPEIIQLFKTVLEDYGAEMTGVESAKEAMATLIANPGGYDVLLSDIGLPEEDGYSLIRQVRELSPETGGQIPAAAITAYAEYADHREALAAGFQMHIAKPIPPAKLLSIVATLAGKLK
ncbi:MAG TPA: chemotaxis protein CheB [Nodularia sp. (in: cyanobacteria)]|nr:chemotaxis protein CheB [Nodularia sp. (in: cyanobacteria)]